MSLRRGPLLRLLPRLATIVVAGWLLGAGPASAGLLPAGFFDISVQPGEGAAAVEADRLSYDAVNGTISAEGGVVLHYQGYSIRADRVEYNQKTGDLHAIGNVTLADPSGTVMQMDSVDVTDGMKQAFLNSLTLTTVAGARITARDVNYNATLATILTDAAYSPCGLCEDSKGRRIGWKVKAARMTYDRANASVILEQPSLELLGMPVAWLPWFWIPDPTQPRAQGMRMPKVDFDGQRGAVLGVPFFIPVGEDVDILLTPQLLSRQGALMSIDTTWRFPGLGSIDVAASGLYQLDPSAFAGTVGDRAWRGAIQTTGQFTPAQNWNVGWSYTAFTDNAYLTDYKFTDATSTENQVYASYLDEVTWFDIRAQEFNSLGNYLTNDPAQGKTFPVSGFETTHELADGWGRLHLTGKLLSVLRDADQTGTYGGVPYVFGEQGYKQHLMLEGAWEDQFILPGGVAATPYLATRLDAANFDDTATNTDTLLLSATPIAALDVRWPLMATNGGDTHLIEPIAQLVYRGSSTTKVGITNDDAHSFVFDTSNLFSYNRFSGIDRQETGLRANFGGHYLGNFADGSWIDLMAGESIFLGGSNSLGIADNVQTGTSTGLGGTASAIVASVSGGWNGGLSGAAKLQVDPSGLNVNRFGAGVQYTSPDGWSTSGSYIYIAPDAALGTTAAQHEIDGNVAVPIFDYWKVTAGLTWDLNSGKYIEARTGAGYDDGYLGVSTYATIRPGGWSTGIHLTLKGPDGEIAF